jgi:hypothetical protein
MIGEVYTYLHGIRDQVKGRRNNWRLIIYVTVINKSINQSIIIIGQAKRKGKSKVNNK